jgi:heme/copper-type cytochrome/quinol oxidase subunit 4
MDFQEMIPFLIPLALLQFSLQIYCIVDLVKRETVRFNNKLIWGVVIILFSILGSAAYLVFGRQEK